MDAQRKTDTKSKSNRLIPIFLNGTKSFLIPAIAIIFSFLVIRFSDKSIWGEFVPFLLFFHLANIVTNWGSKDFLLRSFSKTPQKKVQDWQEMFVSRLPILLVAVLVAFLLFRPQEAVYLSGCVLLAYVSNAVLPVVNDDRDYLAVIIIELIAFGVPVWFVLSENALNVEQLVILFTIYQLGRALLYLFRYASFFRFKRVQFKLSLLLVTFPFFLLAIAGFLQSKFDLYIFERFASDVELADYQIISGFLVFSQALATMILMPYLRNIYRMKKDALQKIVRFMMIVGLPIQLASTGAIYLVLVWFFDIHSDLIQLALFFAIGYPSFAYAVHVFSSFSQQKEKQVLVVSIISAAVNGLVSLILLSLNMGITGVLIAHALSQLVALVGYRRNKLNEFTPQENQ
jgi:O-antigen/teichoic acid export membrane protein